MHFTSYLQDRQLTVALTGEIDHHCAKEYMQHISEKIESYTPSVCVLDFQEVTFMDSSGVGLILGRGRHAAKHKMLAKMVTALVRLWANGRAPRRWN